MSEKRFRFEKECTENFFTEKGVFYNNERPMGANEIIALLNSLNDDNEELRQEIVHLKDDLQYYKTKSGSLEEELLSTRGCMYE